MQSIDFVLRGEFITLDRLLKATGVADSGGRAKTLVAEGRVQVDGRDELRKTAKMRAGQVVALTGVRIRLLPPQATESAETAAPDQPEGLDSATGVEVRPQGAPSGADESCG